jgi:hypothetical protein
MRQGYKGEITYVCRFEADNGWAADRMLTAVQEAQVLHGGKAAEGVRLATVDYKLAECREHGDRIVRWRKGQRRRRGALAATLEYLLMACGGVLLAAGAAESAWWAGAIGGWILGSSVADAVVRRLR